MTDIINLNSIKSDNCGCNKPKPVEHNCGCHKPACNLAINLDDLFFKVKNLFGELKSEWQRTEARSNLGITDIIDIKLIVEGTDSEDSNIWRMITSKGGEKKTYDFVVKNGKKGESATIEIAGINMLPTTATPTASNLGTESHAKYLLGIPRGEAGPQGDPGMSAFELVNARRRQMGLLPFETIDDWLASLQGTDGKDGLDGKDGDKIISVKIVDYNTHKMTFLDDQTLEAKMFIWRIVFESGRTMDFWVPELVKGGGDDDPSSYPAFLYKKIHYNALPTEDALRTKLSELLASVLASSTTGKSIETLQQDNWFTAAPYVGEFDFIFMASTIITNDIPAPWSVVRLTALPGKDGDGKEGLKGTFTSTVFTRTNNDISSLTVQGGDYDDPIPNNTINNGSVYKWTDYIPDIGDIPMMLWSTSCTFRGDGTNTGWEHPSRVMDTAIYDVEFSPIENNPGTPDTNDANWYDPIKDPLAPWSSMIWRAEKTFKNGKWSDWVITRIKGEKGDPGTSQGLMGPVIRMRGTWLPEAGMGDGYPEGYKNQSALQQQGTTLRFIDVVVHNGVYWMANPIADCVPPNTKPVNNSMYWTKAEMFDFAYINTLITEYLSTNIIDADEIRIHSTEEVSESALTGVKNIVAGMTGGNSVGAKENNTTNNDADPIRIWAGSSISTNTTLGSKYVLDLANAKFKVRASGKLEATDADITGTILAKTLRLKKLENGKGAFLLPTDLDPQTITLPELLSGFNQMFYLLTNRNYAPHIEPHTGNTLLTPEGINVNSQSNPNYYNTSINKLYLCFGINTTWYIVELDIRATSNMFNLDKYGVRNVVIKIRDEWTSPTTLGQSTTGYVLESLNIQGHINATFYNDDIVLHEIEFDPFLVEVIYDALAPITTQATPNAHHLLGTVWYKLKVALGSVTLAAGGTHSLSEDYSANEPGAHIWISALGFNGTLSLPSNILPAVGTINTNYPIKANSIVSLDANDNPIADVSITNIPKIN